jgi:hypothetical protein
MTAQNEDRTSEFLGRDRYLKACHGGRP